MREELVVRERASVSGRTVTLVVVVALDDVFRSPGGRFLLSRRSTRCLEMILIDVSDSDASLWSLSPLSIFVTGPNIDKSRRARSERASLNTRPSYASRALQSISFVSASDRSATNDRLPCRILDPRRSIMAR